MEAHKIVADAAISVPIAKFMWASCSPLPCLMKTLQGIVKTRYRADHWIMRDKALPMNHDWMV